jgi:hypothetical protein
VGVARVVPLPRSPGEVALKPFKLMFTCCQSAVQGMWKPGPISTIHEARQGATLRFH